MSKCNLRHCDCWNGITNKWECADCTRNEEHGKGPLADNYVSITDKFTELYDYLAGGKMPDGVKCFQPKMSRKHAFSVIWFLQEITGCLPDHIERCQGCNDLFDTDSEGYQLDDQYDLNGKTLPKKYWGNWCNNCVPCVDFERG